MGQNKAATTLRPLFYGCLLAFAWPALPSAVFAQDAPALRVLFRQDFRKSINSDYLQLSGRLDAIEETAEGLLVSLNGPSPSKLATGVKTHGVLRGGDFEVTGAYEFVTLDTPKTKGSQAGVFVYMRSKNATEDAIMLGRFNVPEGMTYACTKVFTNAAGKRQNETKRFPTTTLSGQLRLSRRGDILRFLVKEPADTEFRELHQIAMLGDEMNWSQMTAETLDGKTSVVVRLLDYEVRVADERKGATGAPGKTLPAPPIGSNRWIMVLIGVLLAALLGLCLWLFARKKRR
jgi:hypothetical protein